MNDEHDTNDAFLSPIEAYALRVKLRKAEKRIGELETRIAALEAALAPFAAPCDYDEDVMNATGDEPLHTIYYGDIDDRDLVEIAYRDSGGHIQQVTVNDLRAAYAALHGKPAPTPAQGTPPELE